MIELDSETCPSCSMPEVDSIRVSQSARYQGVLPEYPTASSGGFSNLSGVTAVFMLRTNEVPITPESRLTWNLDDRIMKLTTIAEQS